MDICVCVCVWQHMHLNIGITVLTHAFLERKTHETEEKKSVDFMDLDFMGLSI